jgi:chromosome segregation ATPase
VNAPKSEKSLYRAEAACALARLEAAHEKIAELEREIARLREENARLQRAAHASGAFPRVAIEG